MWLTAINKNTKPRTCVGPSPRLLMRLISPRRLPSQRAPPNDGRWGKEKIDQMIENRRRSDPCMPQHRPPSYFSNKRHHPPNPTALLPPYFQPTTRNTRATGATDLLPPYFSHQQETPPPPPNQPPLPPYFQPPPTSSRDTATDLLRLADVLEVAEVLLDDVHVGNQRVHNVAPRPVQRLQDPTGGGEGGGERERESANRGKKRRISVSQSWARTSFQIEVAGRSSI